MHECVHCTNTCPQHQPLWPATWSSASLTHGQAYHNTSSTKQLVNGESGYIQTWEKRTSLWTSAKLKPALFRSNTLHNWLFQSHQQSAEQSRQQSAEKKHILSRHFHCSCLKANTVSKIESTRKIIKLVPCLSKQLLAKFGSFFGDTVYIEHHEDQKYRGAPS